MANKPGAFDPFSVPNAVQSQNTSAMPGSAMSQEDDTLFDPFDIGFLPPPVKQESRADDESATSASSPFPPPQVSRLTSSPELRASGGMSDGGSGNVADDASSTKSSKRIMVALPPKMIVKLSIHEEVSSSTKRSVGGGDEGISRVSIEGTVLAQVQCSDARKNSPFSLTVSNPLRQHLSFGVNNDFVGPMRLSQTLSSSTYGSYEVSIPKSVIGNVEVAKYSSAEEIRHMPILVESKVNISGRAVRIGVQVRSNLSNTGDLCDLTLAVAIPEPINGEMMTITRGDGSYDELKRTIKWSLTHLPRGESWMVSTNTELYNAGEKLPNFPVLLRCSSTKDQISSIEIGAAEVDGHPATVVTNYVQSFRLLHRLT